MGVEDAITAELRSQTLGHTHRSAPGILVAAGACTAGNILAHQNHAFVALHFLTESLIDRLPIAFP